MNLDGNFPTYEQQQQILTIAQELGVDVDTLIALLGTPTSAASNSTGGNAHAKLNWLLSILATVNTNTTTANLGAPTTAASNSTSAAAHAKLNWLLTDASKGVVKSVQRGEATANIEGYISIYISSVNMGKSIVSIQPRGDGNAFVSGVLYSSTEVRCYSNTSNAKFTWQVIEYY